MSSQQNRDKSSIAVRLTVAASLVFASAAAQAAETSRPVLTGYSDTVGSDELVAGQYGEMIAEVSRFKDAPTLSPAAYNTNLCVGYIVTRKLDEARKACDAAVRAAKRERTQLSSWMISSRKSYNEQIAIAYSNRAVLHYVVNDSQSAAIDLSKAQALTPSAAYVTRNMAALSLKSTVAQAAKAPQS